MKCFAAVVPTENESDGIDIVCSERISHDPNDEVINVEVMGWANNE